MKRAENYQGLEMNFGTVLLVHQIKSKTLFTVGFPPVTILIYANCLHT